MVLGMEVGLSPGDFMLDGDPAPLPKKGAEPSLQFSVHIDSGKTAGYIKIPLGMEVDLSPGDFVLDGDSAPRNIAAKWLHGSKCHLVRRYASAYATLC